MSTGTFYSLICKIFIPNYNFLCSEKARQLENPFPRCLCPDSEENGPFYTQLGYASSPAALRFPALFLLSIGTGTYRTDSQCCGSGSGIRCLFDPWIRDQGWVKNQDLNPR